MSKRFLAVTLLAVQIAGCDSSPTGPGSEEVEQFPKAFSSQSANCIRSQGTRQVAPDEFELSTRLDLTETSTEALFAGKATLEFILTMNTAGELAGEDKRGLYMPSAVDGKWRVTLSEAPEPNSFTATGTGDGELSGRTIEFELNPLSEGCGFTSSGTIW